ncbi:MAG: hypothetical protein JF593_01475 [Novosphingobium sp.]|nr:hypothetical protein [Novosphingobium sp.]
MTAEPNPSDPARARFFVLQAVRAAGVAQVILGLLITQGQLAWPEAIGWVLIANGMADVFIVPMLLAKRWRTPQP